MVKICSPGMTSGFHENAREIQQLVEMLIKIKLSKDDDEPSLVRMYSDVFSIGFSFYSEIYEIICNYLDPKSNSPITYVPGYLEKNLRYLGMLKNMLIRVASTKNENTFREISREHRELLPRSRECNIASFIFVQQLLGYVWEIYPLVEENANDNFSRELQTLFRTQVECDPHIHMVFHTTVVMICPYVLAIYEPKPENRKQMRQLMRLFVNAEETKKNERYYDFVSAMVYFFIIMHASTGKGFEYVIAQVILSKVCNTNSFENTTVAQVLHIEAALQGLLKALHSFKKGIVTSRVFTSKKSSLSSETWKQIVIFIEDVAKNYQSKEFFGLRRYIKEQPPYV